jgi:hypothetical protein
LAHAFYWGHHFHVIHLFFVQPGPDSIGAYALRRLTGGVAAQACALIDLEAFKVNVPFGRICWVGGGDSHLIMVYLIYHAFVS